MSERDEDLVIQAVEEPPIGVSLEQFTLAYLKSHEAECPACGYNLYALTVARCPECGRTLAVRLVAEHPFNKVWGALLACSALAAGIGVLVLVVWIGERRLPPEITWRVVLDYFMLNIPVPIGVLVFRRRFSRMARWLQYLLADLYALATVAMLAWFLSKIGN